jgi:hypothetical protein
MDGTRWQEVKEVFGAALDVADDARDAWLREACSDDAALLAEVLALLSADRGSSAFLV